MQIQLSLEEIQSITKDSSLEGSLNTPITGLASLTEAQAGDLSFLGNTKYKNDVPTSKASAILVPKDFSGSPQKDQLYIKVDNPSLVLAQICRIIETKLWPQTPPGIHPTAVVEDNTTISPSASIGPFCTVKSGAIIKDHVCVEAYSYIGKDVTLGEKSFLMPRVTIYDYCKIGKRCYLNSGCVIGSQGFGYETVDGTHQKVPQVGNVVIEDDVDVGANTTIDRARFSSTLIGQGTKIDNLVQLAHNVKTGKHCIIVAQSGISGSTTLHDYVIIGGQAGLAGHITIQSGCKIGAQSGISKNMKPGEFVKGSPAMPYMLAQRAEILKNRLPEFFERLKNVEQLVQTQNSQSV